MSETSTPASVDVAVVGAGPAGLGGAITAADAGLRVAVLDLAARIGGQYWRHSPAGPPVGQVRGHGWKTFDSLRQRFEHHCRRGAIVYLPEHAVWRIDHEQAFLVRALRGERAQQSITLQAAAVLIATGAYDRQVPFPGWTLPGVMSVGGAQALLKGQTVKPGRRAVVAGSGPLLLSLATNLHQAGVEVAAIVEASRLDAYLRSPLSIGRVPEKLIEAVGYGSSLLRQRTPYLRGRAVLGASGDDHLEAVQVAPVDSDWRPNREAERSIDCDLLAVGFGFVPQLELALELGCETRLDRSGVLTLVVDNDQQTNIDRVFAAGEPTGVGGADLALVEGMLAGEALARASGAPAGFSASEQRRLAGKRRRLRRFSELLALAHPVPPGWRQWCDAETLLCRCEEVTLGEVMDAIDLGARDARAVKSLSRVGMGRCQARICGACAAQLVADVNGREATVADHEALSRRPLGQPVSLGQMANLK